MNSVHGWMYVSRSLLTEGAAEVEVNRLVELAQIRNRELSITGALVFTGSQFAQFVEGPHASVIGLQASIRRDPRHADVVSLIEAVSTERRFADWSLAYAGPSAYVARTIQRPLRELALGSERGVSELLDLLMDLSSLRRR